MQLNSNPSSILEFYKNKTIFITGVTGFLGKVIFEKLVRSLPQINKIVILIRNKKGINVQERFKKDILDSEIFSLLRSQKGQQFYNHINQKTIVVQGDLLQENLGLSTEDYEMICNNAHIVVNCAASIDFNSKLEDAINANIKGTLKMFALAKKCKQLLNFIHISTCYVNSDKEGFIEEKIYKHSENPYEILNQLESMPIQELEIQTKSILGQYPNTYVFTKSLAERILELERPQNMSLTIVRPAIIGASVKQPTQGWVEGITAASAVFLLSGIGMIKHLHVNSSNIADVIPVDCVSDTILASAAFYAGSKSLNVLNNGVSYKNPINWELTRQQVAIYWQNNPYIKQISPTNVKLIANEKILRVHQIKRRIAAYGFQQIAKVFGGEQMKKNADRFVKMVYKAENVSDTFKHFCIREYIFESKKVDEIINTLSEEEKDIFYLDVAKIDMANYFLMFNWGMHKFILNQQIDAPYSPNYTDALQIANYSNSKLSSLPDINWALTSGKYFKTRSYEEYKLLILNSPKVLQQMKSNADQKEADLIIKEMISNFKMPYIRMMAWVLQKAFSNMYEKIIIHDTILKELTKTYDIEKQGPLIIVPTHRSYVDFLLISYIFFAYKLQTPHIAAAEDFLNVAIVHYILRGSGAFFMKRNQRNNGLYKAIFHEYIQLLLQNNCMLEFFVEGTRSRSGKMLHPKYGIMGIVYDAVEAKKIPNATVLPISISYEKVLESDSFPSELLGEPKVKESLKRLVKAANILKQNYGKIYLKVCEPFTIQEYTQNGYQTRDNVQQISQRVVHQLNSALFCTSTSILSTLILSCRKKGMTEDQLVDKFTWMNEKILQRNGNLTCTMDGLNIQQSIKEGCRLLEGIIISKKSIFYVNNDKKNILMLHYYRNGIIHVFLHEAVVCCVLRAFQEGVSVTNLFEECKFFFDLLDQEFIFNNIVSSLEQFQLFLQQKMVVNGLIHIQENGMVVAVDQTQIGMYSQMITPIIESYWLVFMSFYTHIQMKNKVFNMKFLVEQVQWLFEKMYEEKILLNFETMSQDIIKNALNKCRKMGFLVSEGEDSFRCKINEQEVQYIDNKLNGFLKKEHVFSKVSASQFGKQTALAQNNLFYVKL